MFLLISCMWHLTASAVIQSIELVELVFILLGSLLIYHACYLAGALHNHNLTDAVVLCLSETVGIE